MSLILKEAIKNKTVWESFGPYETSKEVKTKFYGYKDESGKWVVKPEYEFATEFSSGIAIVAKEGDYNGYPYEVINEKGEVLFSINKSPGSDVPVGKDQSIKELRYVNDVKIKDGLIIVWEQKHAKDCSYKGNCALVNKVGEMLTEYVFTNEKNIIINDPALLAKQVRIAGSEVLDWGASSMFLSEKNVSLFKENLKHYLVKKAVDEKLNNEAIKQLAKQEKDLFNSLVKQKQQEVLNLPTYETEKEKNIVSLIEKELEA